MSQLRNFVFTINNYESADETALHTIEASYLVFGREVGESGTPHLQGYCELRKRTAFNKIKKIIPKAHIEPRRGSAKQAADYCKKDGDFFEVGEISRQGERTDIDKIKDEILSGEITCQDIRREDPIKFHQYGRTFEKLEDDFNRDVFRTEMTECDWIYGPTGSGKSHRAFEGFHPSTHYVYKNDKGWWDGYKGQETVIINDFRGEIRYGELLQMIDKWPFEVPRRNREPFPFTSKKVIITSVMKPEEVYNNLAATDGIDQLMRRINLIGLGNRNYPIFGKYAEGFRPDPKTCQK